MLSHCTASTAAVKALLLDGDIDGIDVTGVMAVPNTGGWQAWRTITRSGIPLATGPHLLRLVIDTNGPTGWFGNLNYLRLTAP
jgi:Carbohydrate binding module (family 6)